MADRKAVMRERKGSAAPAISTGTRPSLIPNLSIPSISPRPNFARNIFFGGIAVLLLFGLAYLFKFSSFGVVTMNWITGGISVVPVTPELNTPSQYTSSPIPATLSTNFVSVLQYGYTIGFDVNISNPTPVQNMYRVIFYNGAQSNDPKTPVGDASQKNNVGKAMSFASSSGIDATSLSSIQMGLNATYSNVCMYMAPDTNDLYLTYYVGHFQKDSANSVQESSNGWSTSVAVVKNAPIKTPFRITLAVDGKFIETYLNGQLISVTKTVILGQSSNLHSYNSSYNYNFYGPPDSMYHVGTKIANLQYWGQVLPPASIRLFSSSPSAGKIFSS
jgi:hypothetical protein